MRVMNYAEYTLPDDCFNSPCRFAARKSLARQLVRGVGVAISPVRMANSPVPEACSVKETLIFYDAAFEH